MFTRIGYLERSMEEKDEAKVFLGKMMLVTIGDKVVVVEREPIDDLAEGEANAKGKALEAKSPLDFEGEILTGPRKPNMVEVFQYNCDEPGAEKHTRLVLEDFRKVPPPGLLWCGTSLSAQTGLM